MSEVYYIDGACKNQQNLNGLGRNASFCVTDKNGKVLFLENVGNQTANYAEFSALIKACEYLIENKIAGAIIYSDSKLVVEQVRGRWKIHNNSPIRNLQLKAKEIYLRSGALVNWIPREINKAGYVFY